MTPEEIRANAIRRRAASRPKQSPGEQMLSGAASRVMDREFLPEEDAAARSAAVRKLNTPNATAGAVMEFVDGGLVGFGDEVAAGLNAVTQSDGALSERYSRNLRDIRQSQDTFAEERPGLATTARIAGAVTSPAARVGGPVRTVRDAALLGGAYAATEGFAEGEGGLQDRAIEGAKAAPAGILFSGLTSSLFKGASSGLKAVFQRAESRPTLDTLRTAKNAAYNAVRKTGIKFDENDTRAGFNRLLRKSKTSRWDLDAVSETDKPAFDALRTLQRRAELGRPISLNNLDKTRQKLWDIYRKSDHPFVLEAISEIDNMVATKAQGSEVLQAARAANSKYAKAQLLENAFRKARLQTASTGSGGNILNKYRQAVTRIITTPREARWFSPEELAVMEQFVEGDVAENTMRRIGKLAPGGNGLMTALNVYAASVDPSLLAVTAIGTAAKGTADRSAMRGSEAVLDAVSTGVIRQPQQSAPLNRLATGSGSAGGQFNPF
jgi:hypothetical protein